MALVALDEMDKNNNPLYRCRPGPGRGRAGGCWRRSLQRLCFCQHSCQGEVLASRKDFRMNTCTPHPRGAFMLEPVGLSPMETRLPRTGEGSGVGPGGKEGSRAGFPIGYPALPSLVPRTLPPQSPALQAPSAHSWLSAGPCSPAPALALGYLGELQGWAGLTCLMPSLPEAGWAEEQPMEVSVIRSPVPVPGISQEPGEKSHPGDLLVG